MKRTHSFLSCGLPALAAMALTPNPARADHGYGYDYTPYSASITIGYGGYGGNVSYGGYGGCGGYASYGSPVVVGYPSYAYAEPVYARPVYYAPPPRYYYPAPRYYYPPRVAHHNHYHGQGYPRPYYSGGPRPTPYKNWGVGMGYNRYGSNRSYGGGFNYASHRR